MWGGNGKQVNHASIMWNRRLRRGESVVWNRRVAFNDVEEVDCTSWVCARRGPGSGAGAHCREYSHLRLRPRLRYACAVGLKVQLFCKALGQLGPEQGWPLLAQCYYTISVTFGVVGFYQFFILPFINTSFNFWLFATL